MSRLRLLALGLSALALLAAVATAAYAAGRQHSPGPSTPTDTTTAPPATPPTTQPEPEPEPAPTTTRPATTPPIKLVVGKYCAAMHAAGWSFEEARAYYQDHGEPAHMDADGDGIPCETVYGEVGGQGPAPGPQEDCDPAYPDDCLPSPPPDLDCADVGHRVTVDHRYGDPHRLDADGDGIGCDRFG
jgi:Excalibur calcium-binding domain